MKGEYEMDRKTKKKIENYLATIEQMYKDKIITLREYLKIKTSVLDYQIQNEKECIKNEKRNNCFTTT
jgi:hypothetical protein